MFFVTVNSYTITAGCWAINVLQAITRQRPRWTLQGCHKLRKVDAKAEKAMHTTFLIDPEDSSLKPLVPSTVFSHFVAPLDRKTLLAPHLTKWIKHLVNRHEASDY
jgi:hypothetical protein